MRFAPSQKLAARLGLTALLAVILMITPGARPDYNHGYDGRLLSYHGGGHYHHRHSALRSGSGGGERFSLRGERLTDSSAPRARRFSTLQYERSHGGRDDDPYDNGGPDAGRSVQAKLSLGEEILESATSTFDPSAVNRMVVRKGTARVRTAADVFKVADAATKLVEDAGGYVEERSDDNDSDPRSTLTLRVPVDKYADVLNTVRTSIGGLTAAEEVYEVTDQVRDVTGEYVDVAARAASLEATRKQLQALMVRADDLKDVLEVQRELAQVTAQVEAKKAVMARLGKQASFSTLDLVIRKKREHVPLNRQKWTVARQVDLKLKMLRRKTQKLVSYVIFLVIFSVPVMLLALLLTCLLSCVPRAVTARLWQACGHAYELVGPKTADP